MMKTFYLHATYFATGEGITNYIIAGQAETIPEFLELCAARGAEPYFIQYPDVLVDLDELPEKELDYLKSNHPTLYKIIIKKNYQVATFWWFYHEHFNAS